MEIGKLNRQVTIQKLTGDRDDTGETLALWGDLATVWASIRHQAGMEAVRAGAEASTVSASIRMRRRTDVTASMRILHGMTVYEIKAVLPDEQSRERMDLVCELIT